MSKQSELEKLERTIKDTEVRITTVEVSVVALDKEISSLTTLEKTLKDNIACLKKKSIIAIAQEFRKAKDDLKSTKTKLSSLNNDRTHFKKTINDMSIFLEKIRKDLIKLENNDNVLNFKSEKK